ncbi:hypothetical protein TNCV_1315341 [Trichonephila clavipes]|uniref:Uncharacterized protein n=1 Tax=Trichonephila clavipes TaxID=2585209 RepID=A0A8X6VPE5_TRICX|nr:hypothetical protein TNCV_1315341 [Trichonephila clavipes]
MRMLHYVHGLLVHYQQVVRKFVPIGQTVTEHVVTIIVMAPDDFVGDGERMLLPEIVEKGFLESTSPTFRDSLL